MLVGFRVLQAAGAALLTPTSLGLILATFPAERRHSAVRTWTAVGGLAAALGPAVGGLLVAASWRWVFLVNVPIGVAALIAGWRLLPEVPGHPIPWPDGLERAADHRAASARSRSGSSRAAAGDGADPRTIGVLALAVVLLALFARPHRPPPQSADRPRAVPRCRPFTGASAVAVLFSIAFGAMLLSRVLWAQDVWHWSALTTGVSIVPGPIMVPLFSFLVAGPPDRPLRRRRRDRGRIDDLRRRHGVDGAGGRPRPRLRRRRARRAAAHRDRRRPDAADDDGHGRRRRFRRPRSPPARRS